MEILPYNTEYLRGCVFPDGTEDVSDSMDDTQMEIDLYDDEEDRKAEKAEAREKGYSEYETEDPDDAGGSGWDDEPGAGWDDDDSEDGGSGDEGDDYSDSWD